MAISRASRACAALVVSTGMVAFVGCSVGKGEGYVTGDVSIEDCGLNGRYDLNPTFFSADPVEKQLEIRVQRGSDLETYSDGILFLVSDSAKVRNEKVGMALPVEDSVGTLVRGSFYLNDTCKVNRTETPASLAARGGTITFLDIYAPEETEKDVRIAARFTDIIFVDPGNPDKRFATLSGEFSFLFTRGRPAQRFP